MSSQPLSTRTQNTPFSRWWSTVDHWTLLALFVLAGFGMVLVAAGSPAVAERIDLEPFYFVKRQYMWLIAALAIMVGVSFLTPRYIRLMALAMLFGSAVLMVLVLFFGPEVKGARRWLGIGGMTLQPSEFMKPAFAVMLAWVLSMRQRLPEFPAYKTAIAIYGLFACLLLLQPDMGMTLVLTFVWGVQMFVSGMAIYWVAVIGLFAVAGLAGAYFTFDHVKKRIDKFMNPDAGDNYQVEKSLEAIRNGGLLGRGPGEGAVKQHLPDSHTDFIFAVAGEELGLLACLIILSLFAFVVIRGYLRVWNESDPFILLAVSGLLAQFGIQAVVNMGVAVHLLPAKGMTLPMLSYGGSSMLAVGIGMGMVLALTRKHYGRLRLPQWAETPRWSDSVSRSDNGQLTPGNQEKKEA